MSSQTTTPESLHRTVKHLVDSGKAASIEEANSIFNGFKLQIRVSPEWANQPATQIALLTIVQLARRAFLGGVYVSGAVDVPLQMDPEEVQRSLKDAVVAAGATIAEDASLPTIDIGPVTSRSSAFHVRLLMSGWRAGIAPIDEPVVISRQDGYVMPLSATAAAALAVNEAFSYLSAATPLAGTQTTGMSLWAPGLLDWTAEDADGPVLAYLPEKVWLLGLGHLGQAYAWCLGVLPYPPSDSHGPLVTLQDIDVVTESTFSTSVLSERRNVGALKTRVVSQWLEARSFSTRIIERLFDAGASRGAGDPHLLLCGLDNVEGRRALEAPRCQMVVEAGLGSSYDDFQALRIHTLPASRTAHELWPQSAARSAKHIPAAYEALMEAGALDRCGMTELAGKAVGAAFVGMFAGSLVLSEVLRVLHGGRPHEVMSLSLAEIEHRALVTSRVDFSAFNPGFVRAAY